jgi:hypothetical protein
MEKILDKLGIGEEVRELYKAGMSNETIREKMIVEYPDLPIPTLQSFYNYNNDNTGISLSKYDNFKQNYQQVIEKFNKFVDEATKHCPIEQRKFLNVTVKDLYKCMNEFRHIYANKYKEDCELLDRWTDTLDKEMCQKCKQIVVPKLKELIEKDNN